MAGLYAPLPTLRRRPRGRLRTDRGRRGLLLLHRSGLSPHTPCQSPGALTRVAACTLARSPIRDPLPEGFRHFVASMPAPVASGWSGCRVGLTPTANVTLVEIKTPATRLIGDEYRKAVFAPSSALAGSVVQAWSYRDNLLKNYYALANRR